MSYCGKCSENDKPFPEKVVEIINNGEPVIFHKVEFPASLGDDEEVPPESLDYKNVLLVYRANNHAYLYSSDGEPVFISMGELSVEQVLKQLEAMGLRLDQVESDVYVASEKVDGVVNDVSAIKDKVSDHDESIDKLKSDLQAEMETRLSETGRLSNDVADIKSAQDTLSNDVVENATKTQQVSDSLQEEIETRTKEVGDLTTSLAELNSKHDSLSSDVEKNTSGIAQNKADLQNEIDARKADTQSLLANIKQGDDALQENIDAVKATAEANATALNSSVQLDTTVKSGSSTVSITKKIGKLSDGSSTDTDIELPVASSTQAGVVNPATFKSIQNNSEVIDAILKGSVMLNGVPAEPSQDQLTNLWKQATGLSDLINKASIYDADNSKNWTYYENTGEWTSISSASTVTISQATNTTTGTVRGDNTNTPGMIFVEPDGRQSTIGWDDHETRISNNTNTINTVSGKVNTNTTDISNLKTQTANNTTAIGNVDKKADANTEAISGLDARVSSNTSGLSQLDGKISTNTSAISGLTTDLAGVNSKIKNLPNPIVYKATGPTHNASTVDISLTAKDPQTGSDTTIPLNLNAATTTTAGVMTSAQVTSLNSTASGLTTANQNITNLTNDVNTIKSDYMKQSSLKKVNANSIIGSGDAGIPVYDATITSSNNTYMIAVSNVTQDVSALVPGTTFYIKFTSVISAITPSLSSVIGISNQNGNGNTYTLTWGTSLNSASSLRLKTSILYRVVVTSSSSMQIDGVDTSQFSGGDIASSSIPYTSISWSSMANRTPVWDSVYFTNATSTTVSSTSRYTKTYNAYTVNDGAAFVIYNLPSNVRFVEYYGDVHYTSGVTGDLRATGVLTGSSIATQIYSSLSSGTGAAARTASNSVSLDTGKPYAFGTIVTMGGSITNLFVHYKATRIGTGNAWKVMFEYAAANAYTGGVGNVELVAYNSTSLPGIYQANSTGKISYSKHSYNILYA